MEGTGANTWKEVRGGKSPRQGGGVSRAEGAGGREMGETAWLSRKQMRPYGLKSHCEFVSRCLSCSMLNGILEIFGGIYRQ